MGLKIVMGVSKVPKYGVSESGDTVEIVERGRRGISAIIADGQGSGTPAKRISTMVVTRAMALVAEGARDGAVARAAHDVLHASKGGKVSCTLTIISADLNTESLVISRNTDMPVIIKDSRGITIVNGESHPIGICDPVKPSISEFNLEPGLVAVTFTDGILHSGARFGKRITIDTLVDTIVKHCSGSLGLLSDVLLESAMCHDKGRPQDDMTVVVMAVGSSNAEHKIRKMWISFPV